MAIRRRGHVDRVNKYILVWCGDEREQVSFDGEVFYVPGIDEVAKIEPGSPFKFESVRDRSGAPIPGTVVVADRHAMIDGNRIKVFDADLFVLWAEKLRPDLGDRGLLIVDLPEEVDEAKAEGRPFYERSQDANARHVLEAELFRRRKFEEKGTPPPPSSSEHRVAWAIKHLNERGATLTLIPTSDIVGALTGAPVQTKPTSLLERTLRGEPVRPPVQPPAPRVSASVGGNETYARAKALGVKLVKDELECLLMDDAETIKDVQARIAEKELQAREIDEDLAAAAKATAAP